MLVKKILGLNLPSFKLLRSLVQQIHHYKKNYSFFVLKIKMYFFFGFEFHWFLFLCHYPSYMSLLLVSLLDTLFLLCWGLKIIHKFFLKKKNHSQILNLFFPNFLHLVACRLTHQSPVYLLKDVHMWEDVHHSL